MTREYTIVVGEIEFFPLHCLIHSIDEVYKAGSLKELNALLDTFDREYSIDYIVIELYLGKIEVTKETLRELINT